MSRRFRIDDSTLESESTLLVDQLHRRGWTRTDGEDWDLLWSARIPPHLHYRRMAGHQRVNHYPGAVVLHFKDEFSHFVELAGVPDVVPLTFSMPGDHAAWRQAAASDPSVLWVAKPTRLSGGIGVHIVRELDAFVPQPGWIIQRYIADPLLLPEHPYKHSLRRYVAITSLDPVVAHHHMAGPVKFTSRPYGTSADQLADPLIHFTNPHVQRENIDVVDPVRSVSASQYREQLERAGLDHDRLWQRLETALAAAVRAHAAPLARTSRNVTPHLDRCFELLGFDVVVDSELQPWLVECNVSPALGVRGEPGSSTYEAQRHVKETMISDLLTLIGADEPDGWRCEAIPAGWTPLAI